MIRTPGGNTKLALFEGQPQGKRKTSGYHLVAFRVNGEQFLKFLELLSTFGLKDPEGNIVTNEKVSDHQGAHSIYFCDPYGYRLEITTYDYHVVRARLEGESRPAFGYSKHLSRERLSPHSREENHGFINVLSCIQTFSFQSYVCAVSTADAQNLCRGRTSAASKSGEGER